MMTMERLQDEAKRMVRISSVTNQGNEELANYVSGLMQAHGMKVNLQTVTHSLEDVSKRQFNVIGILGDPLVDRKIKKGLLLNTHLDTVSPGRPENWTETGGDPFCATVKEGKIYGLGTADVKLDFLCKLHAVSKFREKRLRMPIYLVGTCGEELGMFGAKYLIKSMALNPRFVIVGEPSELKVVYAHKCLNIFRVSIGFQQVERDARGFNRRVDLHAFGKSAHSSYPHLGVNAIHGVLDFIHKAIEHGFEMRLTHFDGGETVNKIPDRAMTQLYLTSHQFEDFKRFFREMTAVKEDGGPENCQFRADFGGVGDTGVRFIPDNLFPALMEVIGLFRRIAGDFEKVRDGTFNPAHSTVNLGKLRKNLNGIDLYFDLRLVPDLVPESIEKHIQDEVMQIGSRYANLNFRAWRERMNPSLNMTLEHDLVRLCRHAMEEAGLEPLFAKKSTSTEAAQYFQAGYEAIVFGPGVSQGNSHSPNEHCFMEQLEKATAFYEKLIERVCI